MTAIPFLTVGLSKSLNSSGPTDYFNSYVGPYHSLQCGQLELSRTCRNYIGISIFLFDHTMPNQTIYVKATQHCISMISSMTHISQPFLLQCDEDREYYFFPIQQSKKVLQILLMANYVKCWIFFLLQKVSRLWGDESQNINMTLAIFPNRKNFHNWESFGLPITKFASTLCLKPKYM